MAGGNFAALMHLSELVIIGGAALGAMIIMAPKKVLLDLAMGLRGRSRERPSSGGTTMSCS